MASRVAVAALALAAVLVGARAGRAEQDALRLVWFDPSGLAPRGDNIARAEAAALLARMGASVSWRYGKPGEVRRSDEVWIVLLGEGPEAASGPHVLGATLRRPQAAPIVWVRVPHVCAAVGVSRALSPLTLPPSDLRRFTVALGRVVAHEVVHALVPSLPHGSGLMSGTLSYRQLTGGTIPIDSDDALAFRAALRGDPVFVPPGIRVLAAEP